MAMNDWKMKYATISDTQTLNTKIFDEFKDVPKNVTPYYFLPFRFTRDQVGSYSEQFRYQILLDNSSYSRDEPDVILQVAFQISIPIKTIPTRELLSGLQYNVALLPQTTTARQSDQPSDVPISRGQFSETGRETAYS